MRQRSQTQFRRLTDMDEATYRVLLECVDLIFDSTEGPAATVLTKLVDLIVAYEDKHYPMDEETA